MGSEGNGEGRGKKGRKEKEGEEKRGGKTRGKGKNEKDGKGEKIERKGKKSVGKGKSGGRGEREKRRKKGKKEKEKTMVREERQGMTKDNTALMYQLFFRYVLTWLYMFAIWFFFPPQGQSSFVGGIRAEGVMQSRNLQRSIRFQDTETSSMQHERTPKIEKPSHLFWGFFN